MRDESVAGRRPAADTEPPGEPPSARWSGSDVTMIAAQRVIDSWVRSGGEAIDEVELREDMEFLLRSLHDSEEFEGTSTDVGAGVLRRRILELLRSEILQVWSEQQASPPAGEMLSVLHSLERVRKSLEPNWDQYFASRLTGPEGLELVVEVAHDLRSPLTSILFLSETLRSGQSGPLNEVQSRQLGIVYSAALGLISVASDMIELARGGTKLLEKEPSAFSIASVLESVRDIVQPMADEKGLAIRLVPPASDQRLGYPVALSRVLLNLTSNALKFTEEGSIEISATAIDPTRVEFSIRDTGRGVDGEALHTLFQPFRRSRGRRGHAFSGSGLGLMISRRLVEAMGSELQLETRADWGTRFFFELELPLASST